MKIRIIFQTKDNISNFNQINSFKELLKATSKNCFVGGLRNFTRKIYTFFWLSIAGYTIEKEIERFQEKTQSRQKFKEEFFYVP